MMVDLDRFKDVNDSFGHETGDKILTRVTEALLKQFQEDSYICRLGGDEFAILMLHCNESKKEVIKTRVEKINEKLSKPKGNMPQISISVGVSFGAMGKDGSRMFREADEALYRVKKKGRKDICFYE